MLSFKGKKQLLFVVLVAAGAAYFATFSSLDIPNFLKSYAAIIPAQMIALIYVGFVLMKSKQ